MRPRLLVSLVAFGAGGTAIAAGSATTTARPNIILILADDLGYGDVQTLNPVRGRIATPHIDRLSREGMTFTDAHSGSSVCTPTRYGLLTGRYAWRTHLQDGVYDGYPEPLIAADRLTVGRLLQSQGYHTAVIGKWHLGFTVQGGEPAAPGPKPAKKSGAAPRGAVTANGPLTRGFDRYRGFQHARSMEAYFEDDRVAATVTPIDMLPTLTRHAVEHIGARAATRQPFFLYFALSSPHSPIVPAKDWQGRSGLNAYADFTMQTDHAVGEILAAIEQAGIARNTLVIFASDNGCSPVAETPTLEARGHFASAQFRGYKADIWEGGHRVPLIVRWPEHVRAGARCDTTVCLTDFMATVADLTGVKLPATAAEDSFSFLPDLLGTGRSARGSTVHHSITGRFAIREGGWKLIFCAGSGGWSKPTDAEAERNGLPATQLYHLAEDPAEKENLAARRPEIVQHLTTLLEEIVARGRSTPGAASRNDAPIVITKVAVPATKK
jgi:arylsulfatase A